MLQVSSQTFSLQTIVFPSPSFVNITKITTKTKHSKKTQQVRKTHGKTIDINAPQLHILWQMWRRQPTHSPFKAPQVPTSRNHEDGGRIKKPTFVAGGRCRERWNGLHLLDRHGKAGWNQRLLHLDPCGSMYGIYTYIYHKNVFVKIGVGAPNVPNMYYCLTYQKPTWHVAGGSSSQ